MSKDKPIILILSRGKRLSKLWASIALSLVREYNYQIIATLGYCSFNTYEDEVADWPTHPDIRLIDLYSIIKKKSKPTTEFFEKIRNAEKDISLTVQKSSSNYLFYREYTEKYLDKKTKAFNGFYESHIDCCNEFINSYELFNSLFDNNKIEIVFNETPDAIAFRVCQAIATKREIFQVSSAVVTCYKEGYRFFVTGCNRKSIMMEHFYKHPELISDSSVDIAQDILKQTEMSGAIHQASHILAYKNETNNIAKSSMTNNIKALISNKHKNLKWIKKNFHFEKPKEPYIVFFMHYQPEASLFMLSPEHADQMNIVKLLSINAPAGVTILVKENPRGFGTRGEEYYGSILKFNNVKFLHPNVDNAQVIDDALAVFTISGNIVIDTILRNKKAYVLVDTYYTFFDGVTVLQNPQDIFKYIEENQTLQNHENERLRFLSAYIQATFTLGENYTGMPWPKDNNTGGKHYATALTKLLSQIKEYSIKPSNYTIKV